MNVRPLADRILIRRIDQKDEVRGGIIIPDKEGKRLSPEIGKGDRVLIGKYTGSEVKIEGEDYVILREEDILAIIAKK